MSSHSSFPELTPNPEPPFPPGPFPDPPFPAPPEWPIPRPNPVPLPPDWWRCLRFSPVSGRYEGSRQINLLVSSILDLRVDIDPRSANSPVVNKLSGDFYRANANVSPRPIPPRPTTRVYVESWIVDDPIVRWSRCQVEITAPFATGAAPTRPLPVRIVIPWSFGSSIGPAQVRFTAAGGASTDSRAATNRETSAMSRWRSMCAHP